MSSGGLPSATESPARYFSVIRLNESPGSCSKKPGQVSQHDPQLTQANRSIFTIMDIFSVLVHYRPDAIKIPHTQYGSISTAMLTIPGNQYSHADPYEPG